MRSRFNRPRPDQDEVPANTATPIKTAFLLLSGVMVLSYWGIGLYLIWKKTLVPNLGPELNIALGLMLIVYGAFRVLRMYRSVVNG